MATINLGAIKFNWKGAYNSSTSYAVDDVVSSGGNSYVCIQAHSNQAVGNATAYWNIMSSAGTNGTDGTDVGATLANKEIAFKTNAGAVDGIPIGTAGQFLKVNSGATGYEYGAVSSDYVLIASANGSGGNVNAFDSCFSSTYENYRIYATILTTSSTAVHVRLQNSGNTEVNSGYYGLGQHNNRNSSSNGGSNMGFWNENSARFQENQEVDTSRPSSIVVDVISPFNSGLKTWMHFNYASYDGSYFRRVALSTQQDVAQTFAGIRFFTSSGDIRTTSKFKIYGLK